MITKKNAIEIGKAIVNAAEREKDNNNQRKDAVWVANGVLIYALDNLWYDVFTSELRSKFDYSKDAFYAEVWPESPTGESFLNK